MFLSTYSTLESVLELVGIIIVFLIILAAAYAVSILVGKSQGNTYFARERNIKLIETFRINNSQFLQIVKIGTRYFVLAVSKNHVELISELDEKEVNEHMNVEMSLPFQDVFEKVKNKVPGMQKDNKKDHK